MNDHLNDTEIQQLVETPSKYSKSLMTHLTSCSICKTEYDEYKLVFESLREVSLPPIPDFFADNVVRIIEEKQAKEYLLKRQLIYVCIASTAVLLLGLLLDFYLSVLVSTVSIQMIITVSFLCLIFIFLNGNGKMFRKEQLLGELTL